MSDEKEFNPLNIHGVETIILDEIPDDVIILGHRDKKTGKLVAEIKYVFENGGAADHRGHVMDSTTH